MKKFSKVSAIILAFILAVGLFAATAAASENEAETMMFPSCYHVSYNGNGSTGGSQSDTAWYHGWDTTTVKDQGTLVKTGYTFSGWNTSSDGTGKSYAPGDEIDFIVEIIHHNGYMWFGCWHPAWDETVYGNKSLYAQWAINSYTMSFNSEGGSAVTSVTQNYNTAVAQPDAPTKTGYTFAGWYTGAGGTGSAVTFPYTLTGNVTVYAKWNINYYTMMFDSDGGTSVTPVTQAYNTTVTEPTAPTNFGKTFGGWYTGLYGAGTKISFPYTLTGNITVHAKWSLNTYTLSFDSEGGSAVASVSGLYASFVNNPANPTKDGYTFDGWYLGDNGTGSKAAFPYQIAGNATLYAKWNKKVVISDVSVPAAATTPTTPVTSTTTVSQTPTPTSVPAMGVEGVDATSISVIILSVIIISGLGVFCYKKVRSE